MNRKFSAIIRCLASLLAALALIASGAPAAHAADDPCAAQAAPLDQVHSEIAAHNAEPHTFVIPDQQAAAAAYNAEAARLNAEQAKDEASLASCEETLGALADQGPNSAPLKRPTDYMRNKIDQLRASLPPNVEQYPATDTSGYWRVPPQLRPLFNALRHDNPGDSFGSPYLQGQPRPNIGDPDPAFKYEIITGKSSDPNVPNVTADHIVPIAEIVNLPGFTQLSADNMYIVTRAPLNFQWLSQAANNAKSSRDVGFIEDMDPTFIDEQIALHDSIRSKLEAIIQKLIAQQ